MNVEKDFKCDNILSTGYANYSTSSTTLPSSNTHLVLETGYIPDEDVLDTGRYSIFEVANWFLTKGSMTQKKLQKLCYYAQAWCYALRDYRLSNTDFQAWIHGPVSPALYERFKQFGYEPIVIKGNYTCHLQEDDISLVEDVWATYGELTGNALEALTHSEAPWLEARRGYAPNERCTVVITPRSMREYYKSIYSGNS